MNILILGILFSQLSFAPERQFECSLPITVQPKSIKGEMVQVQGFFTREQVGSSAQKIIKGTIYNISKKVPAMVVGAMCGPLAAGGTECAIVAGEAYWQGKGVTGAAGAVADKAVGMAIGPGVVVQEGYKVSKAFGQDLWDSFKGSCLTMREEGPAFQRTKKQGVESGITLAAKGVEQLTGSDAAGRAAKTGMNCIVTYIKGESAVERVEKEITGELTRLGTQGVGNLIKENCSK